MSLAVPISLTPTPNPNPSHSRPTPVPSPKNPAKESAKAHALADDPDRFEQFWPEYPRKTAKEDARKAFTKLNPNAELFEVMMAALRDQRHLIVCGDDRQDSDVTIGQPRVYQRAHRHRREQRVDFVLTARHVAPASVEFRR